MFEKLSKTAPPDALVVNFNQIVFLEGKQKVKSSSQPPQTVLLAPILLSV
jgi:hypothetical protein